MMSGRIIQIISQSYKILLDNHEVVDGYPMGKLRLDKTPLVGDKVLVEKFEGQYGIQEILERENRLFRPNIANVDQVFIVMSSVEPDFNSLLCDKMIFKANLANIHPILVFTKLDKVNENHEVYHYIEDYKKSGYETILVSKYKSIEAFKDKLDFKISVLSGNSGVGKSTILNRLDSEFQIRTQQISKALNRGKHTTTNTTLFKVGEGYLADTPGFSTLSFEKESKLNLAQSVFDFQPYLDCKFTDCLHVSEPHCHVKLALEEGKISQIRYNNYLKVLDEIKED